jgi:hypothetical protein
MAYRDYLGSIRSRLPGGVGLLADTELHDYRIVAVSTSRVETRLRVASPWRKPRFQSGLLLKFEDVKETSLRVELEGRYIVAQEVLMYDNVVRFSALLNRDEFFVDFVKVNISTWGDERP